MNSIKDCGLPETDKTYLVLCPDYEPKPFLAYLDETETGTTLEYLRAD